MKESELKHRLIFESAKDAILLIKDGLIVDCNSITVEMFGCLNTHQIRANKIDRIFERFAQEDKSIGVNFGGLGVGHSIVKEHVGLLKGEISVQSVKEEGSTFTI